VFAQTFKINLLYRTGERSGNPLQGLQVIFVVACTATRSFMWRWKLLV